ncbi:MAG: hypothetical protein HY042_05100 [Spirochaetia bacterium]|nr:hypothetical protein [Spirochaetia bacterium]
MQVLKLQIERALSLSLFLLIVPLMNLSANPYAKAIFEQAYRAEEKEPDEAVKLYRKALASGLDAPLATAARWKLFYLYKKSGDIQKALLTLGDLGWGRPLDSVYEELRRDLRHRFTISDESAALFLAGAKSLATEDKKNALKHFRESVKKSPNSLELRGQVVSLLSTSGETESAMEFLREDDDSPPLLVLRADALVARGNLGEARTILRELSVRTDLDNAVKGRVLYLHGRIAREENNVPAAVRYFRLAASYLSDGEAERQNALAAFSLYKAGYAVQAKALLDTVTDPDDWNIELLSLILRVQVDGDADARAELTRMRPRLEQAALKEKSAFLPKRALDLIGAGK